MTDDTGNRRVIDAATIADLREQVAGLRETRGNHAAKLEQLDIRLTDVGDDVKKILAFMERSKGSWKTLVMLGTAAGTVVEGVHWLAEYVRGPH